MNNIPFCPIFWTWSQQEMILALRNDFIGLSINKVPFTCGSIGLLGSSGNKGQLISKGLFDFFNSSKKWTKNCCPSRLGQKSTFSSSFFGRIERFTGLYKNFFWKYATFHQFVQLKSLATLIHKLWFSKILWTLF